MRNTLPKQINHAFENGIVNLDDSINKGTHWVAYKKHGNIIHYFDSYGNLPPPKELLTYFFSNGHVHIKYNYENVQKSNKYMCGHLCLKFLLNDSF